jgi:hypothetical protein
MRKTRPGDLRLMDTGLAIVAVDQVIGTIRLAEDAVRDNSGPNDLLSHAAMALQLAQEKLDRLRDELEAAPHPEGVIHG